MPNPTTTSPTGSQQGPLPDSQALITLLTNLMPLLQRMQAQIPAPFWSPDQFLGYGSFGAPNPLAPNPLAPNPSASGAAIDHQAAVSFVEDVTADRLRDLSTYLDAHAEQHQELATCVSAVSQAARYSAMRDYSQALGLIWQAYRVIAAARSANPQIPPLRATGQAGATSGTPLN